ncbi:hypothetical protein NC652_032023 [Populus alba x Populus x berolinensis]|nr:hypothetical protein NC652_032023 [Populus alba x Populus x berolinensis]
MNQQVANFGMTVEQMRRYFRGDNNALTSYLSKCIFYSGWEVMIISTTISCLTSTQLAMISLQVLFAAVLLQDYTRQLTQLYALGARKVIVTAIGQIGCIPYQLARYNGTNSRCNEKINNAISLFNSGLLKLVQNFNNGRLPGAKFVYLDSYKSSNDLSLNGTSLGFEVIDKGCCGVGRNNGQITCLPLQQTCPDRSKYIYWDAFHPTEVANNLLAKLTYNSQTYTYPMSIQQLTML